MGAQSAGATLAERVEGHSIVNNNSAMARTLVVKLDVKLDGIYT